MSAGRGDPRDLDTRSDQWEEPEPAPVPIAVIEVVIRVIEEVSDHYGVSPEDILGRSKKRRIVDARHAAMFVARTVTGLSFPVLGRAFDRDHTTVLSAVRAVEGRARYDADLAEGLDALVRDHQRSAG